MDETIADFAMTAGKMIGYLGRDDVLRFLKDKGVLLHSIQEARSQIAVLAEAFYEGETNDLRTRPRE